MSPDHTENVSTVLGMAGILLISFLPKLLCWRLDPRWCSIFSAHLVLMAQGPAHVDEAEKNARAAPKERIDFRGRPHAFLRAEGMSVFENGDMENTVPVSAPIPARANMLSSPPALLPHGWIPNFYDGFLPGTLAALGVKEGWSILFISNQEYVIMPGIVKKAEIISKIPESVKNKNPDITYYNTDETILF